MPGDRPVLLIDTTLDRCAVGLLGAERLLASRAEEMRRGHAERLFPMLAEMLAAADISHARLGRIIVAAGPGNFTGIRIGIAAARGLALGLAIPAIAVSTLEALAGEAAERRHPGPVTAAIAGPGDGVYWQRFEVAGGGLEALSAPAFAAAPELARLPRDPLLVGSAAGRLAPAAGGVVWPRRFPELRLLGRIGRDRAPGARPAPVYLRPPDARPQPLPAAPSAGW